jgi:hypothetical protein
MSQYFHVTIYGTLAYRWVVIIPLIYVYFFTYNQSIVHRIAQKWICKIR